MTSRSISMPEPENAQTRRSARKETVYAVGQIPALDMEFYQNVGSGAEKVSELTIPARDGGAFEVPAGHLFRIVSVEGSQVGDFNLWNSDNLSEHFYSGKTRAIHATHISTGDRLWSSMPYLRPMATITYDSLGWYGWDSDGCGIHDVIGTRCDPYTRRMITGEDYDHCCHSNLVRALSAFRKISAKEAEGYVHDVMNVFMCTGFDVESHEYIKRQARFVQATSSNSSRRSISLVRYPPVPAATVGRGSQGRPQVLSPEGGNPSSREGRAEWLEVA